MTEIAGLTETILCYDGIAVIVNPENTVKDMTLEQIAAIYTGEIKNWSEVGCVTPCEATVKDGTYAIQHPFVLATRTGVQLGDAAQAFFNYVTSADAKEIIVAAGVVPANKST